MPSWVSSFFDNPEELLIGACLQFPLYFIVGWWILPIMLICSILWRLGGWEFGNKFFRRLGAPIIVCGSAFLFLHQWQVFLVIPFMTWIAPSYGEDSWLYKKLKNDFLVRFICFTWYWTVFALSTVL